MEEISQGRKLGPEPMTTANCPYLGTEFCHSLCDRGDFLPESCVIECQYCEEESTCPCNCKSLPWKFELNSAEYLVINPHHSVYHTVFRFRQMYNRYPIIEYLDDYGIIAIKL